ARHDGEQLDVLALQRTGDFGLVADRQLFEGLVLDILHQPTPWHARNKMRVAASLKRVFKTSAGYQHRIRKDCRRVKGAHADCRWRRYKPGRFAMLAAASVHVLTSSHLDL